MIGPLTSEDIGRYAIYRGGAGERERGRIKSFNNARQTAWVVYYHPGRDMQLYEHYTAACTNYDDLFWPVEVSVL